MKTDLTYTGSYAQSSPIGSDGVKKPVTKLPEGKVPEVKPSPDYKLDLSSKVSIPSSSVPKSPDVEAPKLESVVKDKIKDQIKTEVSKTETAEIKAGTQKKAAIIFIKGLDIFSSPSKSERGYAGVGRMAESVEGSRIYGWDQKNEIMDEIKKVHADYPVILVGHSLGGDTAIEIAEDLDSLDNKFRAVDLLVTIDAVGFQHDVIPQNVKNHLNIFGENDFFLNDGPHVARNHERTVLKNILNPMDHTEIDDQKDVQFEVTGLIQKTLNRTS